MRMRGKVRKRNNSEREERKNEKHEGNHVKRYMSRKETAVRRKS